MKVSEHVVAAQKLKTMHSEQNGSRCLTLTVLVMGNLNFVNSMHSKNYGWFMCKAQLKSYNHFLICLDCSFSCWS